MRKPRVLPVAAALFAGAVISEFRADFPNSDVRNAFHEAAAQP